MEDMQKMIKEIFGERDSERNIYKQIAWLTEELGELIQAIRKGSKEDEREEFADVLAWLISLANVRNIDLKKVFYEKYNNICSRCKNNPCKCSKDKI